MPAKMPLGGPAPLRVPGFSSHGRSFVDQAGGSMPFTAHCPLSVPACTVRTRWPSRRLCDSCLILVLLFWLGPACFAQTLRVRVLDCTSGHPLPKQQVALSLLNDRGERINPKNEPHLRYETDADGSARFKLPEPVPLRIEVDVSLTSQQWSCGCFALLNTRDVIRDGAVEAKACRGEKRSKVLPKPEPGEILFLALPPTWWQKLLWPLTKD
jgi:hypothetical protein